MGSKFNSEQTMEIEGGALDGGSKSEERTYLCIDLKSFYASVECADRGLDPFTTNLVVADPTRSANTICLAITPALKAQGVKNRCRLGDIPDGIEFTCAMPRMSRYMEVSANIVGAYQRYVSPDDMHIYSIDEAFIDATPYLKLYGMDAKSFARALMDAAFECAGVTATAGIGPNLLMAKVALDVCAKHAPDGIGVLDDDSWKREIWFHRPITDIWGIGPGIARRLERRGVFDLAGICTLPQKSIVKEFGKNGLFLLDHAWGQEPCTISQARNYKRHGHSISNGQVLMRDYRFSEARTLIREMALASCLELTEKGLAATGVGLYVGYSASNFNHHAWGGGRAPFMGAGGSAKLPKPTDSASQVTSALLALYEKHVDPALAIRRVSISLGELVEKDGVQPSLFDELEKDAKETALAQTMVAVRERFGENAVLAGTLAGARQAASASAPACAMQLGDFGTPSSPPRLQQPRNGSPSNSRWHTPCASWRGVQPSRQRPTPANANPLFDFSAGELIFAGAQWRASIMGRLEPTRAVRALRPCVQSIVGGTGKDGNLYRRFQERHVHRVQQQALDDR